MRPRRSFSSASKSPLRFIENTKTHVEKWIQHQFQAKSEHSENSVHNADDRTDYHAQYLPVDILPNKSSPLITWVNLHSAQTVVGSRSRLECPLFCVNRSDRLKHTAKQQCRNCSYSQWNRHIFLVKIREDPKTMRILARVCFGLVSLSP